jgi:hypothetical protein
MRRPRLAALAAIAIVAAGLAACASPERQINQAAGLGEAGIKMAETLPPLYDAFFSQAVEADSLELAAQRETEQNTEAALKALDESNADFEQSIAVIVNLKRHAALLRSYFVAFKALAAEETGAEIPGAAKTAVETLQKVGGEIAGRPLPGVGLAVDIIEPAATAAVQVAKSAALRAEFEARGTIISREIALQEEAVDIIATRMIGDRRRVLIETEENRLTREFATNFGQPLPSDWWQRRSTYLSSVIEIAAVTRAQSAVRNLRIAWEDMAAGRGTATTVDDVIADLNAVADQLDKLKAAKK